MTRLLLYYPFTPFFVLFGNLTRNPRAEKASQDLQLLKSTTAYFSKMTSQGNMASKLEKVAHVFSSIAENCINNARSHHNALLHPTALGTDPPDIPALDLEPSTMSTDFEMPFEVDPSADTLLSWFSDADFLTFDIPNQHAPEGSNSVQGQDSTTIANEGPDQMRGTKRPLECTFDWFSWDLSGLDKAM